MWSDAERATDILKRSRRPLLSFFLSPFFLPHATTCLSPFSNRSILPQPLFSCPVSATAARRSCPCPVSAAAARRPCPVQSCPRPPPRAVPVLSDPVLGRRRAPFLSCPIVSSAAATRQPRPCPATQSPVGPAVTLCCVNHSSGSKRPSERNYYCHPRCLPAMLRCLPAMLRCLPAMSRCLPAMLRKPLPLPPRSTANSQPPFRPS